MRPWTSAAHDLKDFAALCCDEPHVNCSVTRTHLRLPIVGAASARSRSANSRSTPTCPWTSATVQRLSPERMRSGHVESVHRSSSITAGAGSVTVFAPQGHASARWAAGSRMIAVKIDRDTVDDALAERSDGRCRRDRLPTHHVRDGGAASSWVNMLLMLAEQSFQPGSVLTRPLVTRPFVDSLVRGLSLATDHPHRDDVTAEPKTVAPYAVRTALDIIEAEAHLPLTGPRWRTAATSVSAAFRRASAAPRHLTDDLPARGSAAASTPDTAAVRPIARHGRIHRLPMGVQKSRQIRRRTLRPIRRTAAATLRRNAADAVAQPGNTGSAPGVISGRTSAHAGSSSAAEPDSCSTPRCRRRKPSTDSRPRW